MKYSFYNVIRQREKTYILYNTLTENILLMSREVKDILLKYSDEVSEIENIHPSFYNHLTAKRFIVKKELDEKNEFIETLIRNDQSIAHQSYRLIINPTMDCNLRCWYCYEEHLIGSEMNEETIQSVKNLIDKILLNKSLKTFTLGFFGGEPLMKFWEIICPLMLYTKNKCNISKINFRCHFTTNALLLAQDVIDFIVFNEINLNVQVPFDGGEVMHNLIKKSTRQEGAYRATIQNIFYGLNKNISFVIRCNCTNKNIDSFKYLIDEFKDIRCKKQLSFSIQRVWQEKITTDFLRKERELYKYIIDSGFNNFFSGAALEKCYADGENSSVINYNGDVFKCTANEFTSNAREGKLLSNGDIVFNNLHQKRLNVKYKTDTCTECTIYPICTNCSQFKLKNVNENGALQNCSKQQKDEILINRLEYLLTTLSSSYKCNF